jgi:hypothetical protein
MVAPNMYFPPTLSVNAVSYGLHRDHPVRMSRLNCHRLASLWNSAPMEGGRRR